LIGKVDNTGQYLEPIEIDNNTWWVKLMKGTDTTVQKLQLNFQFSQTESDEDLRIITTAEMDNYDLKLLSGLLDGLVTIVTPLPTGFTAQIRTKYGSFMNSIPVPGLIPGDFALENLTTPGPIVPTSVVETPALSGDYVFVIPAQSGGDNLKLTTTKTGYEIEVKEFTV
jgi:hypothetical protein